MNAVFTTPDGLAALVVLVLLPLAFVVFAFLADRDGSIPAPPFEAGLRTLILIVLLVLLPDLVNGLSSILQLGFRPSGGGWIVSPAFTFIVGPVAYIAAFVLGIRRVVKLRA